MRKEAVILLSGGIDSTTTLAYAIKEGFIPNCITFRYGQKNEIEIHKACYQVNKYNVKRHVIMTVDLSLWGGSALTDIHIKVPENLPHKSEIPPTYVPGRNIIFLSIATSWAEVLGIRDIFIGVNQIDYSGYPDCREEFIKAFEDAINKGTKSGNFKIHTPFIHMKKSEIIKKGLELGVDYRNTFSCYNPTRENNPCGKCASCILRRRAFEEAGVNLE